MITAVYRVHGLFSCLFCCFSSSFWIFRKIDINERKKLYNPDVIKSKGIIGVLFFLQSSWNLFISGSWQPCTMYIYGYKHPVYTVKGFQGASRPFLTLFVPLYRLFSRIFKNRICSFLTIHKPSLGSCEIPGKVYGTPSNVNFGLIKQSLTTLNYIDTYNLYI